MGKCPKTRVLPSGRWGLSPTSGLAHTTADLFHPHPMRAVPERLTADTAQEELARPDQASCRHEVLHLVPANGAELSIAGGTSWRADLEPHGGDHPLELGQSLQASRQSQSSNLAGGDRPALEEPAVGRDQHAMLAARLGDQHAVVDVGGVSGVVADGSKPPGQSAAHGITGKPQFVGTCHRLSVYSKACEGGEAARIRIGLAGPEARCRLGRQGLEP